MAGGTDGGGDGERWACDVLVETQQALSAVTSLDDVAEAVTGGLVSASLARLAWIRARSTIAERLQVVALESPSLTVRREQVAVDGEAVPPLDGVSVEPTAAHAGYGALTDAYELPAPATTVSIPVENGDEGYGVLTVCTNHDIAGEEYERLALVGRAIADRCWALERSAALDRERERIETVRSRVSHDLGNPVNIAAGRLELATDDCESSHIDHAIEGLETIETLTDDTVTFIEAGQPPGEQEEVDLEETVREAWRRVNPQETTLDVTAGTLRGNADQVRRLCVELIENAREHAGGAVSIRAGPLEDGQGFFVADDGPGIPPDEYDAVVDLGYSTGDGGGMGLTVVAEIAGAHGWTVSLSESDAGGTRIECRTDTL